MRHDTDIVVTGMGVISALGDTTGEFWSNCIAGVSGAAHITAFDASNHHSHIACEIKNFDPDKRIPKKQSRRMARFSQLAVYAAIEAVEQAGLKIPEIDPTRIACLVGAAAGGYDILDDQYESFIKKGPKNSNPLGVPKTIANMAACTVAINLGITGPNLAVLSACATGAHNIALARMMIKAGYADVVVAGGTEATISPMVVDAYGCMGVLSTRNDDPLRASRPFDKDRDGFVIGEGAGILILESRKHAESRGAKVLSQFSGVGMTCDASSIAIPDPQGIHAARAMNIAITEAGITPDLVDYINAHGTSTHANDLVETIAIQKAFGAHAEKVSISSIKSMIGHTLGAAGAIEAVATILALQHQIVPPTINLENPDTGCTLDYTANKARKRSINYAISNSFGFGGQNCCLLFEKE